MAPRGRSGGRIPAHERVTDDTTPTITATGISEAHQRAIFATSDQGISARVRKDYRLRIRRFVNFIFINYPEVYEHATVLISQEQRDDPGMYFYPQDIRDLTYSGLDVSYFLAFLSEMKEKENGKVASYSHVSKFYDAIKYGSKIAGRHLSLDFYTKTDTFMFCFKKEFAQAKKQGNTDEREADAVSSTLLSLIVTWAVEEGNVFVWVFCLCMWHLMARSCNVDCLSFHNMKRGISDSIVFKYDETKMDKTGEFVQEKNVYSNPLFGQGHLCMFTALGVYLSIHQERLAKTEKLFLTPGAQLGNAAQTFARQVGEIAKRNYEMVRNYCRLSHFNIHGLRKGGGTHATSATTLPPQFTTVACRGEWSMGKVLDIYFQFAQGGDYYLGQLLTLKDPNSVDFDTPCPHWKDPNAPIVLDALDLMFSRIYEVHGDSPHDPHGVLSILLASVVHHSDWMLGFLEKDPSHPFSLVPILSSPLLQELKANHVTFDLNVHVSTVTGIPPHVAHMQQINNVKEACEEIKTEVRVMRVDLKTIIHEAIDEKVEASGGINTSMLDKRLGNMEKRLAEKMDSLDVQAEPTHVVCTIPNLIDALEKPVVATGNQFCYRGHYWCVPESFSLPREADHLSRWHMWLKGMVIVSNNVTYRIKPFRLFQGVDFPSKAVMFDYANKWMPIFGMMEQYGGFSVRNVVDDEFVHSLFNLAAEY
mgnify:CR=1 FL=1